MACPLEGAERFIGLDREGFAWDTGISDECRSCIYGAQEAQTGITEYFKPDLLPGETLDCIDQYTCVGIRMVDDASGLRELVEEVGLDSGGVNEGSLISKTVLFFACNR